MVLVKVCEVPGKHHAVSWLASDVDDTITKMSGDIIIIGGGVIGCSIAWHLAKAGVKVTLIERGRIGQEASWAAAGMLGPHSEALRRDAFFDLCIKSRDLYPSFSSDLRETTGIDPEYRDEGGFFVALDQADQQNAARWSTWQLSANLGIEQVSASDLRTAEPSISESALGGFFIPGDHQIDNRKLMQALESAVRQAGVDVTEGCQATALLVERDCIRGVECGDKRLEAGVVVVAAGCWSSSLLKPAGLHLDVTPARGQMLAVRGPELLHVAHSHNCYLVPRRGGRLLIGATVERAGFRKAVTANGLASLIEGAIRLAPCVASAEVVETWSGLRPDTPDHLPILGPSGIDGLILATGHFRNGILLAPITAKAIAELIVSNRAPVEIVRFGADRFCASAG